MASETDLKYLLSTYQKKSIDLFTQLVVAETKLEQSLVRISELEEEMKEYKSKDKKDTTY